jgi:hypothetical protein
MLRFFACTAILAVVSAQLSPAEQQALADAQALIDKLNAAKEAAAQAESTGPSIDTLDGSIIIGVGPSHTVSMNVGGKSAVSVSSAAATNSADSFVEMKVGTAAIKAQGDDLQLHPPVEDGDVSFGFTSVKTLQADAVAAAEDTAEALREAAAATASALEAAADKARLAQEAIDLALANAEDATAEKLQQAAVEAENRQKATDKAIKETKDSITTVVAPQIDSVKNDIKALQAKIQKDIDEGLKKEIRAIQNGLFGVSAGFPAPNCQGILEARPQALAGEFWITSKIDKKVVRLWCAKQGSKFVSLGGDGSTKGQAAAGCFAQPLILGNSNSGLWIDPNPDAEDPNNAAQKSSCGDGKSKESPGLTCKSIKIRHKVTSNQHYWVIGRNQEYKSSPKEVFCWQDGRDGGGWTFVLRSYYQGHHRPSFNGNGVTTTGNVRSDPLQHLGGAYKMHDHEIRSVIGQPDHKNDNAKAETSTFSWMFDQSYRNTYYSGGNYEYTITKNYNARWRFYRFQTMEESKTKLETTAYDMNYNFNGRHSQGDGSVNWVGEPRCGRGSSTRPTGAGISCRGAKSGKPSASLRGGRGCQRNRGYDRWHGQLHLYMCDTNHDSYMYMCNGPQHSSGNRFAHRSWLRTPDSDTIG